MRERDIFDDIKLRLSVFKQARKEKGLIFALRTTIMWLSSLGFYYHKIFRKPGNFKFQNKQYKYFWHKYGITSNTERAVEIPIIRDMIKNNKSKRILEVGNVLSHYYPTDHDVLDKYERGEKVINKDIVDYNPSKKYDLIVTISTLEHIGLDEKPDDILKVTLWKDPVKHLKNIDPIKILKVIEHLKEITAEGGKIIITIPLGYNENTEKLIFSGAIKFNNLYFLKRISSNNLWREVKYESIKGAKYNYPFARANGLLIGIINK